MKEKEIEFGVLQDECLDMLVRAAFKWQEIKSGQDILSQSEEELNTEDIERGIRIYESFRGEKALIDRESIKTARKLAGRRIGIRVIGAAACIVLLLSIAAPFAIAHIEPIRTRVLSLLIEIGDRYASVSVNAVEIPENWQGRYYMRYLPEGFELVLSEDNYPHVEYKDKIGRVVKFTEHMEGRTAYIDSENWLSEVVKINGIEITILKEGDFCALIWSNGDRYFVLNADIERDDLLRIAQSLKRID